MIKWLRASHNAVPINYPCLMLLDNGDSIIGMYTPTLRVIAWTVINRPEWMMVRTGKGSGKVRGERHPKTQLTDDDCELIRTAYETGSFTYQSLADKYECSKSTVRDIIKFRTRHSARCG